MKAQAVARLLFAVAVSILLVTGPSGVWAQPATNAGAAIGPTAITVPKPTPEPQPTIQPATSATTAQQSLAPPTAPSVNSLTILSPKSGETVACMRSIQVKVTKMEGWVFLGFTAYVTVTDANGEKTLITFPGNPVTNDVWTPPWNAGAEPNGPCTLVAEGSFTDDLRVAAGNYDPALLVTAPQSNVRLSSSPVAVIVDNGHPSWQADTAISGGAMINPQNQTVTPSSPAQVVICAGDSLPCAMEVATDSDKLYPAGCGTPAPDNDDIRYKWEATNSAGAPVGGFEDSSSQSTNWIVPLVAGDYTLTCRVDDAWDDTPPGAFTGAGGGEVGNRNDLAIVRQVTVTVTNDEVFKIIVDGSNPENPGPAYTVINAPVTLRAVPSLGSTFAAGAPAWHIAEQPAGSSLADPPGGATATLNPQVIGKYVIVAGCESFTLYCIKVTFTEDLGQAYGFDDYSAGGPFKAPWKWGAATPPSPTSSRSMRQMGRTSPAIISGS